MHQGFWDNLHVWGERPALVFAGQPSISYRELSSRVDAVARSFGTGRKLIAIETGRSEHPVIAYLAALKAGHVAALLPAGDPQALAAFRQKFSPDLIYRKVGDRWRLDEQHGATGPTPHPELALLLITSGSSGNGKTVRLSAGAISSNTTAIGDYLGLTDSDRAALVLPWHYSYGLSVLNSHLASGGSVFFAGSVLDTGFAAQLRDYRCTSLAGVPSSFDLLETIGFRSEKLPDLRFMTVAGGRLAPSLAVEYARYLAASHASLYLMYGQTEATARIAYLPPHLAGSCPDSIGRPVPGGDIRLVDASGADVFEPGTAGELVYRGPNVMMGYANSRADLSRGRDLDELRTGDLATADGDGLYRIVGRLSRISKISGRRIGHDAMEADLGAAGIGAVVVGDDQSLLAIVTSGHSARKASEALAKAAGLPLTSVNAITGQTLPMLANGKIDYQALRDLLPLHRPEAASGISEAFDHAFFPRRTAPTESFISIGGDSLRHLQLSMELDRRLGHIPPGWEKMSIAALSALEPQKRRAQPIAIDLIIRALAILLVVTQHATLWPIPGGSAAMVVLIGYNLARFQKEALTGPDFRRFFKPVIAVLVPYYLIVAGYSLAWQQVPWASVALAGNFGVADPERHTMLPFLYWFVEAFVQIMAIWALIFALPQARRMARRDPFMIGMAILAAGVALRFGVPRLWAMGSREIFSIYWVFYLAALGWCAAFAETRARRFLLLALAALILIASAYYGGNWTGSWVRYGLQFAVLCALLYLPAIALPARFSALVLPVAVASYHIYLFHRLVPEVLLAPMQQAIPPAVFTILAIVGGVAAGILAQRLQSWGTRALAKATLNWPQRKVAAA